jgi:hypothetical protein
MQSDGCYRRLTVKEHLERVRFDPTQIEKLDPSNGFRLIFPKHSTSAVSDDEIYDKY